MSRASTNGENNAVQGVVGQTPTYSAAYLGMNTGDPSTSGANEVTGGTYARQAISWGSAAAGSIANSAPITINIPASTTIDYFSTWGASSGGGSGGYIIGGALSSTITFVTAGTVTVLSGGLTVGAS